MRKFANELAEPYKSAWKPDDADPQKMVYAIPRNDEPTQSSSPTMHTATFAAGGDSPWPDAPKK